MRCKPHARFGRRPGETEQTATLSPRPGPTSPRHPGRRRRAPPGPAGHPRPPRPQGRPAVPDPEHPARRRRTPDRPATRPARHRVHRSAGAPRSRACLAVRPAGPSRLPPAHPRRRPSRRREGPHLVHQLPDPRGRPPRPHPEAVEPRVPRLLRHRTAPTTAAPRPSTASSSSTAASPAASATATTTDSECSSSQAGYSYDPTLNGEEPLFSRLRPRFCRSATQMAASEHCFELTGARPLS